MSNAKNVKNGRIFTKFLSWIDLRTRKIPLKFGGHRSKVKVTEIANVCLSVTRIRSKLLDGSSPNFYYG